MKPFIAAAMLLMLVTKAVAAEAERPATLVVDAGTGQVLAEDRAALPRHPASLTKMMTVYVALKALEDGRVRPDTPVRVSDRAAGQTGSVLGLKAGDELPLAQALSAVVVRSANDAAVALAETLSGSEIAFAARMTAEARRLGMDGSNFANATGLTSPGHVTTPRDMAVLALALKRDFPQHWSLFSMRAMEWRKQRLPSVNPFLDAVKGAEGMKTGFTCPAGYNLAAAALRDGASAIAIVMGAASKEERVQLAARLVEQGLGAHPPGPPLAELRNKVAAIPDLTPAVCSSGVPGETAAAAAMPGGWAMEVAYGASRSQVRGQLDRMHRQLALGGTPVVVTRPFDGGLRYQGIIAGLKQDKAVPACLKLRQKDEDACLVLTPEMAKGAVEEEKQLRMLSAR